MQSSTIVKLKYKDIHSYRYRVSDDVFIPFLNDDLKHSMSFLDIIIHPYFVVNKDGVYARKNYTWDGATYAINTKNLIVSSLVHRQEFLRQILGLYSCWRSADADYLLIATPYYDGADHEHITF